MESTTPIYTTTNDNPAEFINEDVKLLSFQWIDYFLFCAMFAVSAAIGIYFGCFGSKQSNIKDYLLGGKSMSILPIAVSLIASNLSGITLLGMPAEIYMYGTQFWACVFSAIIITPIMAFVYLPVFHKLQLNSSYEYLEARFDRKIRNMASLIFLMNTVMYVPIVIYIPAIAFNQVTGINMAIIAPVVCLVCIFYTTLGGLKAVVWTDTLQFTVTLFTMSAVLIIGIIEVGGFGTIWTKAEQSGRIEFFNFSVDPTERCTFWSIVIGLSFTWLSHFGVHQASIQRYLALPNFAAAKKAVWIFGIGVIITKSISCFSGLIMYAKYDDCDPISSGQVKRMDQLIPYYVLDIAKNIPGLSGIFVSGVCSTALSTMSTSLNTMAGTIYEDFLVTNNFVKKDKKQGSNVIKVVVIILGVLSTSLVFIVDKMSGVLQIANSIHGIAGGPLLGIFSLGMLFPSANTTGALYGSITAFIFATWMCFGQQFSNVKASMIKYRKEISVAGCEGNATLFNIESDIPSEEPFFLYRVSFYWYAAISFLVTIVIGLIISHFTRKTDDEDVDKDYLSPVIYRFLREDYPEGGSNKKYMQVPNKLIENTETNCKDIINNKVEDE